MARPRPTTLEGVLLDHKREIKKLKRRLNQKGGGGGGTDVGPVDLSGYFVSGISGTLYGTIRGGTVELYGQVTKNIGGFASSATVTEVFSGLPAQFRPASTTRLGNAGASGYAGAFAVRINGTGGVWQRSDAVWGATYVSAIYTAAG